MKTSEFARQFQHMAETCRPTAQQFSMLVSKESYWSEAVQVRSGSWEGPYSFTELFFNSARPDQEHFLVGREAYAQEVGSCTIRRRDDLHRIGEEEPCQVFLELSCLRS